VRQQALRTEPLSTAQLRVSIPDIARLLDSWGEASLVASYGIMCELPMDDLYQPIETTPAQLEEFVQQSERRGIFKLGGSDLDIRNTERTLVFTLCHESDIHFESRDQVRVDQVLAVWREKGLTVYVCREYVPVGPVQWERVG
jgi:hypothetical protein